MKEKLNREYTEIIRAFKHTFGTPDGRVVFDFLRREYGEAIIDMSNPTLMAGQVGARNMFMEMVNIINYKAEDNDDE